MKDEQCVRFLQWALPQMHMRWWGFRKVRRQVCKRLSRRMQHLSIGSVEDYQDYLQEHADEWEQLDSLCRITISRFNRDRAVFSTLAQDVLPLLAHTARERGDHALRIWSAGCGSGEEPYTLTILWYFELQSRFSGMPISVVATDSDPNLIERAHRARYAIGSLKELPENRRVLAFSQEGGRYRLEPRHRSAVRFLEQDIRQVQPEGRFDLVLCRNLVFTYFDEALQRHLLNRIAARTVAGGALVLGIHEQLPANAQDFSAWFEKLRIYRKSGNPEDVPNGLMRPRLRRPGEGR
jgi:chemotaxis protein methyltransferase CheR